MLETALVTVIAIITLIIAIVPIAAWLVILIVRSTLRNRRAAYLCLQIVYCLK